MSPVRPTLQVVGRRLDPEHYELRDFLTRIAQPHEWYEAGSPEAEELVSRHGLMDPPLPVVVDGKDVVAAATIPKLSEAWHMINTPARSHYDLAIVGGGPAGLGAAVGPSAACRWAFA